MYDIFRRGLYTHKDSLVKVGWVYPQYKELIDPGTYVHVDIIPCAPNTLLGLVFRYPSNPQPKTTCKREAGA